jgi:hypothetical protein
MSLTQFLEPQNCFDFGPPRVSSGLYCPSPVSFDRFRSVRPEPVEGQAQGERIQNKFG